MGRSSFVATIPGLRLGAGAGDGSKWLVSTADSLTGTDSAGTTVLDSMVIIGAAAGAHERIGRQRPNSPRRYVWTGAMAEATTGEAEAIIGAEAEATIGAEAEAITGEADATTGAAIAGRAIRRTQSPLRHLH